MHTAAFLALTIPLSAPALKDGPATSPSLVGRWECTVLLIDGRANPQWNGLEYEFTKEGKWIIYRNGQVLDDRDRTYHLDAKVGPEVIEVTEGPRPQAAAFRVEKDTLQLAIRTADGDRPPGPESTGNGIMTFTFQRVKAGK